MRNIFYLLLALNFMLASCATKTEKPSTQTHTKQEFTLVQVPVSINDNNAKLDYLAKHFWDNFNFSDSLSLKTNRLDQFFGEWINILNNIPLNKSRLYISETIKKAESNDKVFEHFTLLSETLLYEPQSIMRNEELYMPVLETIIASSRVDSLEKLRPKWQLKQAQKNRINTPATDFSYITIGGKQSTLNKTTAPNTLLMFNNPGCEACGAIIGYINQSAELQKRIANGTLKVLAIFADASQDEWRSYAHTIPQNFINGYDKSQKINSEMLYDLKAIPCLYLLDKDKKILLKDAEIQHIEQYLIYQK
ncbi:MAG: DUF5106 domain-containing protein [Rikenellaceae bacterium]